MPDNNSNHDMKPHHLYEIIDKEGEDVLNTVLVLNLLAKMVCQVVCENKSHF